MLAGQQGRARITVGADKAAYDGGDFVRTMQGALIVTRVFKERQNRSSNTGPGAAAGYAVNLKPPLADRKNFTGWF